VNNLSTDILKSLKIAMSEEKELIVNIYDLLKEELSDGDEED